MINSFLDLVKESQEIDEMGVPNISKLTGSSLGKVGSFGQGLRKLRNLLKNIKSTEIVMEKPTASRTYYPRFTNQEVIDTMQALYNENPNKFRSVVGEWYDINGTGGIHMETDSASSFQRSHFPGDGIPETMRGIGLGKKLYRALLRKVGYISSNTSGTSEKDNVWASMVQHKPDEDDAYAIVGSGNWIVFDKSMDKNEIIRVATKFLDEKISFNNTQPDKFDMDDELFSFMPEDILSSLDERYLNELVRDGRITQEKKDNVIESRARAEALARERADREAAEARERVARKEAQVRANNVARLSRYGVNPDADWDVGDFIVVKDYLYNGWEPLPIREVADFIDGQYYAVHIKEMIKIRNGEISVRQANDNRTTRDKVNWLKVDLDHIPDLDNVNFSREEKEYVEGKLSPETAGQLQRDREATRTERQKEESEENVDRINDPNTYGFVPSSGRELKELIQVRPQSTNINLLKKFKSRRFYQENEYIIMGPPQINAMRNSFGVPVFVPWVGSQRNPRIANLDDIREGRATITNLVTGINIQQPYGGLGLRVYPLTDVTVEDKIRSRVSGEHFFIAGHQNVYGIIAKGEYGAVNTQAQKFIYLNVYGYAGRSVSVRLDLLKKLGAPIRI